MTIGHEFVGRVSRRGPGTVKFRVGDRVVCGAGVSCGTCDRCADGRTNLCAAYYTHGLQAPGGLAEAVVVPASICVVLPDNVPTQRAVLAQPLAVATHAVRRADMHAARLRPSSALAGSAPSSLQQPPAAQAR